jgi:hypothetical protein
MFPSEISTHSSKQFFTCQIKGVWDKSEHQKLPFPTKAGGQRKIDRNPFQCARQERAHKRTISSGIQFSNPSHQNYPFQKYYNSAGPNLDMHSSRYMCEPCGARLYDVIHGQQRGFLKKWQMVLKRNHYKTPVRGLKMAVRMSADEPPKGQKPISFDNYTVLTEPWMLNKGRLDNCVIFEADSQHLNLSEFNSLDDFFKCTVFVSCEQSYLRGVCTEIALASFVDLIRRVQMNILEENNIQYEQLRETDSAYKLREIALHFIRTQIMPSLPKNPSDLVFRQTAQNYYLPWKHETFNTLFYL